MIDASTERMQASASPWVSLSGLESREWEEKNSHASTKKGKRRPVSLLRIESGQLTSQAQENKSAFCFCEEASLALKCRINPIRMNPADKLVMRCTACRMVSN